MQFDVLKTLDTILFYNYTDFNFMNNWMKRILFLIITFGLNFFLICTLHVVHQSFLLIVVTFLSCLILGLYLKLVTPNAGPFISNLAWGLLYGSLSIFAITLSLIIWLAHLYK